MIGDAVFLDEAYAHYCVADSNSPGRIMKILPLTKPIDNQTDSPIEPDFPSVRYFQIHFEYLHETIDELRRQVDQANQQIAELQQQLQGRSVLAGISPERYTGEDEAPSDLD